MPPVTKTIVLEDHFQAVKDSVSGAALMEAAKAGGFVVEGHAKINAGSGRPGLQIQTGALVNSIIVQESEKRGTSAVVDIGTNMVYARIHELGGVIVPVNAKKLSWIDESGNRIFAGAVHIPARPYLRPALDENEKDIIGAIGAELQRHIDGALE